MTNKTTALDLLIADLGERGIKCGTLHVMFLSTGEQIIGETTTPVTPGEVTMVWNPKRLLRLQQVLNGGISINLMIGDLDLLEKGWVKLIPQLSYKIEDQSEASQLSIFGLYKEYLDRQVINKAAEAGLVIPPTSVSPFRK